MFQEKLKELRQHFRALLQLSHGDPAEHGSRLQDVLERCRCSLQELRAIAEAMPQRADPKSNGSARTSDAPGPVGEAGIAHWIDEYGQVERHLALRSAVTQVLSQAKTVDEAAAPILQLLRESQLGDQLRRESAARTEAILEASLDAVITIDEQGRVVEFNPAAESIFGYRRRDVVARGLMELIVPPRLREQVVAGLASFKATGECEMFGKRFGTFALRSDGSEFPVEVALASIETGHASLVTIYLCDATARNQAQEEVLKYQERVRSLMADLLLAEEHERRRLAVDLHDGLSQTIALANIKLSALRKSLQGKPARALGEIGELITQADRAARSIGVELSPPALHELGLEPAVQWLVEHIQARYGIEIALEDDGLPKPADEKTRVILFRSIRELLINAAKHARARQVTVRLGCDEDHLVAAVEDDGVGMEARLADIKGSGLFSIHERLSHVSGTMHIDSAPGRGTRIRLCAPLTKRGSTRTMVGA